ncbi:unnamed protein product [Lactuca saligna]|uniref:Uncharacterized protein n=1 Tax=Lactuca saligna TaxID=75948 RepID=A0AA35ZU29_LACSI|nr:unnamed protein product [Lactuca saligna]
MQATIDVADKQNNGGKGSKKGEKKTAAKEAHKRKTPTPFASEESDSETDFDIRIKENQPVPNQEEVPIRNQDETTNPEVNNLSVTQFLHQKLLQPLSLFPPVSSSQPISISISSPILTESTTTSISSTNPEVTVNISDMGANTSVLTTHVSLPISPIRQDDPEMIFGDDDDDDLGGFTYRPFQIRTESEDEATVTKGQLKSLHEKIDQLLLASKASSSEAYSKETVESLFECITKEHAENVAKVNKAVSDSADVCKSTTEKVDKLISETTTFMENYRTTYNNNTASTNEALQNLGAMFKTEKKNMEKIHTGL